MSDFDMSAYLCIPENKPLFAISGLGNSRELKQISILVLTAGMCWSKYGLHQSVLASRGYLVSLSKCFMVQHETAGVGSGAVSIDQTVQ